MRKFIFPLLCVGVLAACNNTVKQSDIAEDELQEYTMEAQEPEVNYEPYGELISEDGAITESALKERFKTLKEGDTLEVKFAAEVQEVCKKKGCWMKIGTQDEEVMIRFKDYGFFMPKDIEGKTVVAEGKAYLEEISVDAQKHYLEDGGASEEEIAAVTEPKLSYVFRAHGVLVPEN
ncbi:MAG: DUF4920 domain-containing protein [Bacteroidetes bacterium]|jgi:hypothetical protein|nr:DUF4920 domain-containing protein [Bacteroidota bacterium]